MQIDGQYNAKSVRQIATAMREAIPECRAELESMFRGDQTDDFYRGLFAGYVNSHALLKVGKPHLIKMIIAFLAERMEQKEIL
jgi:hypothetical protein